nr:hypothetical protein [Tanacetum cinerariifolium]
MSRLNSSKCQLTTCALCARNYLGKTVNVKGKQPQKPKEKNDFSSNEVRLLKELLKEKTEQVQQMVRDQAKEYYENKTAMQKKKKLWQSKESLLIRDLTYALKIIEQLKVEQIRLEKQKDEEIRKLKAQLQKEKKEEAEVQLSKEEFPSLRNSQIARPCIEMEDHYSGNTTTSPKVRKITNQLYNVKVEFDIPNCPTFGTTLIIDTGESTCCINKKIILEEALEPLTQIVFFNGLNSDSKLLTEGDEITIYKKVTRIKTSNQTKVTEIAELEVNEEEFLEINESIYFNQEGSKAFLEQFKHVIDRLNHQGYIREEPLKHWKKNGELCKLDIINPYIIIEDRPLKHVTPAMEDSFRKHVDSLLKIGVIRPRKERMVFNYKSLNDNTYKDQYSLTGINTIIKRIGGTKIFSKFDLKSGFHQVAMDEESITWTTFLVPRGLYEWIVMPFELKNALEIKIAVSTIDFLGAVIGEGTIKLQPHIIKKIVNFNEEELKTKKGLRKIKEQVQNLPDLEIPPENAYIILETDGCMEGCGGIVKWKKSKGDPKREMKQLATTALYSVEEVLQSLYAFQKNMKITYITTSKPIKHQSKWINLMYGEQSPKTLKFQQQKKQSKPCEVYRQSYNVRPKYALENPLKTTSGLIKEKMSEFKTKKPKESSLIGSPCTTFGPQQHLGPMKSKLTTQKITSAATT